MVDQTERRAPNRPATVRPVTPGQRAAQAERTGGEPTLEFADMVPYDAYVQASALHRMQHRSAATRARCPS